MYRNLIKARGKKNVGVKEISKVAKMREEEYKECENGYEKFSLNEALRISSHLDESIKYLFGIRA